MTDGHSDEIIYREIDTDRDTPAVGVAEMVSELEGVPHQELTTMYEHLDHLLAELFSAPPVAEAQVEVEFTYEGYRITVGQDGNVSLIKTAAVDR